MKSWAQDIHDHKAVVGRPPRLASHKLPKLVLHHPLRQLKPSGGISWCHQGEIYVSNKYLKRNIYFFEIRFMNNLGLHHRSSTTQTFDNIFELSNKIDILQCMRVNLEIIQVLMC